MKKYLSFGALLIACMFMLYASASAPEIRAMEKLIPDTAFFYMNVTDVEELLNGLDAFTEPLGLKSVIGKEAIKKRMVEMLAEDGGNFKIDGLNFKKPWGFALLPSQKKGEPDVEILVPLNNAQKNFEPFKAFVKKAAESEAKLVGDYAVLFKSGKPPAVFPPKKSIDLSEIDAFPRGSVSMLVDVKKGLKAFGFDMQTLKTLMTAEISETEAAGPGVVKIATWFIDLLDEIEIITFDMQADKAGIAARSNMKVTKGKTIDNLLKPLASSKGLTSYAKYIPSDYLFSMSAHTDPDFSNRIIKFAYAPFIDALGLSKSDKSEIMALMNKFGEVKTTEMGFGFDFDMDFKTLMELGDMFSGGSGYSEDYEDYEDFEDYDEDYSEDSEDWEDYEDEEEFEESDEDYDDYGAYEEEPLPSPEELKKIVETIGSSIKMNVVGVTDLKDKDKYRKLMEEFSKSQVLNKMMDSWFKEAGIEGVTLKYSVTYLKDKKVGSLLCDEFGFNMDLVETGKAPDDSAARDIEEMKLGFQVMKPFLDQYRFLLHFANNKCYMAMGKDAVSALEKLVKGDSYPSPNLAEAIRANPRFKELYDSSQIGYTMSMIKYINLLRSIPDLAVIPELKATGKEVGIISATRYADGRLESTGYWGMDEIKQLFNAVNKTLKIDKMLSM